MKKAKACGGKTGCQCRCGVCDIDTCNCPCHELDNLSDGSIRFLLVKYDGQMMVDVQDMSRNWLFMKIAHSDKSALILKKGNQLLQHKLETEETLDESNVFPERARKDMLDKLRNVIDKRARGKSRVSMGSKKPKATSMPARAKAKTKSKTSDAARKRALARCKT